MRRLIVTADDFGLAPAVNEAVERGHIEGILSTTSLMVSAPAAADAIERAQRLPRLRVGLHVVLVDGRPLLPLDRVSKLVDANGDFATDHVAAGVKFFFTPGIRAQMEDEIRAQFAAFAATGLQLDHVNAQSHMHVHPTVLSLILKVGREYGMRAIRIPYEPYGPSWRAMRSNRGSRLANAVFLAPWLTLMRMRLHAAGIVTNDYVFGLNDSGHMTPARVRAFLQHLPDGVTELYLHPATQMWPEAIPPDYEFAAEFKALIDDGVARTLRESDIQRVSFTELARA